MGSEIMFGEGRLDAKLLPVREIQKTLFEMFIASVAHHSDNIAYIYKVNGEELRVTYSKLFEDVLLLSRAFKRRGLGRGDKVMLLSDNRYSWIVTDLALLSLGAVNVPRGSDTPTQELEFIVEHSESVHLIVESSKLLDLHADYIKRCRQIKDIFIMVAGEVHTLFGRTYSYQDLLANRQYSEKDVNNFLEEGYSSTEDDFVTIIYTSGTTGVPKGVQLSNKNIMHNVDCLPGIIRLTEEDLWLSILPSWHIFERTAEYVALAAGTTLVYSTVRTLVQDLERYKPTLLATVPRVWESLYSKVDSGVRKKGAMAYRIFTSLIWCSSTYRRNRREFLDRLPVFAKPNSLVRFGQKGVALVKMLFLYLPYLFAEKKLNVVRQRFGGRLRLAISGGGSLADYLEEWVDAVGIRIVNAYGMTECSPAIAGRGLDCRVYGTVGAGVTNTRIRLVDDDGLEVSQGKEGLIEVVGDQVMGGYYKNDVGNIESFTDDGFFRTGDLGRRTISGDLVLTGRAKDIIVLSSGENIDPSRIESAISVFPFVQDAILVGQDKKGLGALLVADREELLKYADSRFSHLRKASQELLKDNKVLELIRKEMNDKLRPKQGFKSYEKLHKITFLEKEFKLGEELTNTLKKKRHVIEKKYHKVINDLLH
ncbi:related to long-chain-fatty-acid--CoA ligase [Desulfotalea psychrophila LSv54]|uniref:Related to long-chain-fatty-acid--CoA ligase n=2 Tax=Desulfotalea psychrophila TaxID=84980 RepID=Q6ANL2_DESPS|nr:related to long-chain-fatty-acid--CoA ligase [Desulfotalea psychrophila LSv54]